MGRPAPPGTNQYPALHTAELQFRAQDERGVRNHTLPSLERQNELKLNGCDAAQGRCFPRNQQPTTTSRTINK